MATQSARELQAATAVSVHAMQKTGYARRQDTGPWQAKEPSKCYRCGATQHPSRDCPFKEAECHFCHKKGHLEKVCFAKKGQPPPTRNGRRPQTWKPSRRVQACHAEDDAHQPQPDASLPLSKPIEAEAYSLFHTVGQRGPAKPIMVPVTINHAEVTMELDTGAAVSLISIQTYQSL